VGLGLTTYGRQQKGVCLGDGKDMLERVLELATEFMSLVDPSFRYSAIGLGVDNKTVLF